MPDEMSSLAEGYAQDRRSRRTPCSLTISALMASAALNAACFTLLINEEVSLPGNSVQRPSVLVQSLPKMELAIRQRARTAEAQLRHMQARATKAAKHSTPLTKASGKGKQRRFSLRTLDREMKRDKALDHSTHPSPTLEGVQQLSGVHAEAQFNFQGTTFGRLEPRILENGTETEEEDKGPVFMENAPPGAMSFGGKDCSPTEIIGGVGVPNPYDALFPPQMNQITIEAWVCQIHTHTHTHAHTHTHTHLCI
jgi:hypothetical protein